jgi:hypothetical protein
LVKVLRKSILKPGIILKDKRVWMLAGGDSPPNVDVRAGDRDLWSTQLNWAIEFHLVGQGTRLWLYEKLVPKCIKGLNFIAGRSLVEGPGIYRRVSFGHVHKFITG